MKDIYLWFYCLPLWQVLVIIFIVTVAFCFFQRQFDGKAWWRTAVVCMLAAWLLAVLWATLADRAADPSGKQVELIPLASYWKLLQGGNPEILRVNWMNMILFYPIGLLLATLLPQNWKTRRSLLVILAVCCAISIGIEYAQYNLSAGLAEIDDVIHNTFGGTVGATMLIAFCGGERPLVR